MRCNTRQSLLHHLRTNDSGYGCSRAALVTIRHALHQLAYTLWCTMIARCAGDQRAMYIVQKKYKPQGCAMRGSSNTV